MSWQDYGSAPACGTPICPVAEIGPIRSVTVTTPKGAFPLLLIGSEGGIRAFVNACPHQYLPLDHLGPRILSQDGGRLICSAHGAVFDACTGRGLAGPGVGCALDPVPVHGRDGMLLVGAAPQA